MLMLKKGMRLFTIMVVFFFSNTTVYFVFASEMLL